MIGRFLRGARMLKTLALLCLLAFTESSQARIITAGVPPSKVVVYTTPRLGQKFVVIGKVSVQASAQADLIKAMQRKAEKLGGDAVLNYAVMSSGQTPVIVTGREDVKISEFKSGDTTISHTQNVPTTNTQVLVNGVSPAAAEGIVVKFDSAGIEEITSLTPVPVLN